MPHEDLLFTGSLVSIGCNVDIFEKWQFIFLKSESDLDSGGTNKNGDLFLLFHPDVTKMFNAAKMNGPFQKSFLASIRQFIKIGDVLADDRIIFCFDRGGCIGGKVHIINITSQICKAKLR